ncbi:MAG: hypothetical protein QOI23_852, partial [Chloroflexota bacterium]|nr:hypothetical protein [Chloroflexota bacterium]
DCRRRLTVDDDSPLPHLLTVDDITPAVDATAAYRIIWQDRGRDDPGGGTFASLVESETCATVPRVCRTSFDLLRGRLGAEDAGPTGFFTCFFFRSRSLSTLGLALSSSVVCGPTPAWAGSKLRRVPSAAAWRAGLLRRPGPSPILARQWPIRSTSGVESPMPSLPGWRMRPCRLRR